MILEQILAGLMATILTWIDLSETFKIPSIDQNKSYFHKLFQLYLWWMIFVLFNGVIACLIYPYIANLESIKNLPWFMKAILGGIISIGIVRFKITDHKINNQEIPVGMEFFYQKIKIFVYKQINYITREIQGEEIRELSRRYPLQELCEKARTRYLADNLLSDQDREQSLQYIGRIMQDSSSDQDKCLTLASLIIMDRKPHREQNESLPTS